VCIGWSTNQVTLRNARCNGKDKMAIFANLPKAPNLRIQLVLTEVDLVSDNAVNAVLHLAT